MAKSRPTDSPISGFAVASLVLGIIAFIPLLGVLSGIVGIVLGAVGLKQIRKYNQKGKGLAVAGIILGSVGILFTILLYGVLFYMLFSDSENSPFRESRIELTETIMRQNQGQLELYRRENERYPTTLGEATDAKYTVYPYDHFMTEFTYQANKDGSSYEMRSAGPDKEFGTADDITMTS